MNAQEEYTHWNEVFQLALECSNVDEEKLHQIFWRIQQLQQRNLPDYTIQEISNEIRDLFKIVLAETDVIF